MLQLDWRIACFVYDADVALHEAVGSGRQDLVAWLMRQGEHAASVTNNDGRSPLHVAAINNNIKMCKVSLNTSFYSQPIRQWPLLSKTPMQFLRKLFQFEFIFNPSMESHF